MITSEDIQKIEAYIKSKSVRDADFDEVTNTKVDDYLTIVQDGDNKKISVQKVLESLNFLNEGSFLNATNTLGLTQEEGIPFNKFINKIKPEYRKPGMLIAYKDYNNIWYLKLAKKAGTVEWVLPNNYIDIPFLNDLEEKFLSKEDSRIQNWDSTAAKVNKDLNLRGYLIQTYDNKYVRLAQDPNYEYRLTTLNEDSSYFILDQYLYKINDQGLLVNKAGGPNLSVLCTDGNWRYVSAAQTPKGVVFTYKYESGNYRALVKMFNSDLIAPANLSREQILSNSSEQYSCMFRLIPVFEPALPTF